MSRFTYYVVQPYVVGVRGKLVPCDPIPAEHAEAARLLCELHGKRGGALAFYRSGDPDTGDFDDAVVVYCHGKVPEQFAREVA